MDDKIYQMIYDEISGYLLPEWEEAVVYLEYGEESYAFSLYEKTKTGYSNVYDNPGVSENAIDESFRNIDKLILKERKKEKGDLWSNMTMVIKQSGDMRVDFDYTDLSEGTYKFKKSWKKKYLK